MPRGNRGGGGNQGGGGQANNPGGGGSPKYKTELFLSWTDKDTLHVRASMYQQNNSPCTWETALGFGDDNDPARYSVPDPADTTTPLRIKFVDGKFAKDVKFPYAYSKGSIILPDNSLMVKPIPARPGTPESAPIGAPSTPTSTGPNFLEFTTIPAANSWTMEGAVMTAKGPAKNHPVRVIADAPLTTNTNDHGHFTLPVPVTKDVKVTVSAGGQLIFGNIPLMGPHTAAAATANKHWVMKAFLILTLVFFVWSVADLFLSSPSTGTSNTAAQQQKGEQPKAPRRLHDQPTPAPSADTSQASDQNEQTGLFGDFLPEILFVICLLGSAVTMVISYRHLAPDIIHKLEHHAGGFGGDRKSHHFTLMVEADGKVTRKIDGQTVDETGKHVKPEVTTTTTTPTPGGAGQTTQTTTPTDGTRKLVRTFVIIEVLEQMFPTLGKIARAVYHMFF